MAVDVGFLIEQGRTVHRLLAPEGGLFGGRAGEDRGLAWLSLLSRSQVYWEAFVCLIGFGEGAARDFEDILPALGMNVLLTPDEDHITSSFLAYSEAYFGGSREDLIAASYALSVIFEAGELQELASSIEKIKDCIERCGDDTGCFARCYNSGGGA